MIQTVNSNIMKIYYSHAIPLYGTEEESSEKQNIVENIPNVTIVEISEMLAMDRVRQQIGKNKVSLIQACDVMGVGCSHKNLMDEKTEKFKQQPDVIEQAKIGARKWVDELGWGSDFSFNLALRRIAGGMAILEAFNEFVDSDGDTNSLFYDYAIGDLMSEKALYLKMK